MKLRYLLLVITLISSLFMSGCGPGSNGRATIESTMRMLPQNCPQMDFYDIAALRCDLHDVYMGLEADYERLNDYGISWDDVDCLAMGKLDLLILVGSFDAEKIREDLVARDYEEREYRSTEVWESDSSDNSSSQGQSDGTHVWVALKEDVLILGERDRVIDSLKTMNEELESLYDDELAKSVIDRLPVGMNMLYTSPGTLQDSQAEGWSYRRKSGRTLDLTVVHKFPSEEAAQRAQGEFEQSVNETANGKPKNVNTDSDIEFLKLTAEVEVDDLIAG